MSYNPYNGGSARYPPYPGGAQGGYPGGVPSYGPANPPYPPYGQSTPIGFNIDQNQPTSGYPPYSSTQPGYPATSGQPAQPGYPPASQPGYPPTQVGYPPALQPGYPPASQPGYPPASQPGYPPASQSGYPPASQPGYPSASQPGFPPPSQPGYPGSQPSHPGQPAGYPTPAGTTQSSGYPGQPGGYPGQPGGYPGQPSGYLTQTGYPGQQAGYPGQQAGYPGQQAGYPSQQTGYSGQQTGYPGQQAGYPGQQAGRLGGSAAAGMSPAGPGTAAAFRPGNTWYLAKLQGTIRAAPGFDPASDAHALRKAMKGLGTDEKAIINVLCRRNNAQRQQIAVQYKSGYGRDLLKDLKSELGGKFENVILGLMMPPYEYLAQQLYKAMEGMGTDEDVLYETLCTHSNAEVRTIKDTYHRMYNRNLERDVHKETSGHFRKVLTALLQANRDESGHVDQAKAANQAQALYKAGEKKLGTDEETFNVILVTQNPAQLQAIMAEYEKLSKKGFIKAIESETSGDYRQALMAIVKSSLNRTAYFAERLRDTMKGLGTRDNDLIRLVISRSEYDLANIKQEYLKLYGKTLEKDISSETSGDYKKALVMIVEGN